MCEFSTKLVRWLDQELAGEEAVAMEQHVAACPECRSLAAAYQEASQSFALLTNAVSIPRSGPGRKRAMALLAASAIAAALVVLLVTMPRHRAISPRIQVSAPPVVPAPPAPVVERSSSPSVRLAAASLPRAVRRTPEPVETWMPAQPTIRIAIPSDALFPPGAVPEGFAFAADLSLAPDGTPAALVLRP